MFNSPFDAATNNLSELKKTIARENLFSSAEKYCNVCKTRLSDFLETGFVGCANCYNVFYDEILKMVADFHKGVKHVGKRPSRVQLRANKLKEIERLTALQAEASNAEDYLLAQQIKEKVQKLRSEL